MSSSPFATRYIVRADQTAGRFVLTERPIPPVQVTSPLEVWLVGGAARGGARPLPQSGARERFAIVRSPHPAISASRRWRTDLPWARRLGSIWPVQGFPRESLRR